MLLSYILERVLQVSGKTQIGNKLKNFKGINYIILGEGEPQDVHGIPKNMLSYGRGWVIDGKIEIEGGTMGSSSGHPNNVKQGFYWSSNQNTVFIRGRAGTDEKWIENNIETILNLIINKIPKK